MHCQESSSLRTESCPCLVENEMLDRCAASRVLIWAKEQKKKQKDKPGVYWDNMAAKEYGQYKVQGWYKRFAEAITRAERVLLYTTGFRFNVYTGFYALLGCKVDLQEHADPDVAAFFREFNLQASITATPCKCQQSPAPALSKETDILTQLHIKIPFVSLLQSSAFTEIMESYCEDKSLSAWSS